ncbi:hypothetical protein KKH23_11135 [Patescibacteria group bacterium]|nr:hypothetical protein [Patescibacteria group bacterium]
MPRRPVREFLARIPLLGRPFRRYRTVTAYGETFCPNDFTVVLHTDDGDGPLRVTVHANDPADREQAKRLEPHAAYEQRLVMAQHIALLEARMGWPLSNGDPITVNWTKEAKSCTPE